ncbi:hypothetical protein GCM10010218_18450 [Streptomyces mashuensis]|uniref:DUF1023 domain-containing protein n=1 Tax=Streptomyces mashuensis TaxID=33904 RepID=A0A919B0J5_9ACTN|nr:alpha/beta hydrolase [Streptomyces mashuensis]GHF37196.1 hypothetical protein GCM10010218_18450 [Streptomyces mashuensis]
MEDLVGLDIAKLTDAGKAWSAVSNYAGGARDFVDQGVRGRLAATQQGEGAKAALEKLGLLSDNYQYIHVECGMIRTLLQGLAEELAVPQRNLKQALEDAHKLNFTVKEDGSVEYPRSASTPSPLLPKPARSTGSPPLIKSADPNEAKAQVLAERIGTALKEAAEIDGRYARAVAALKTDGNLKNTDWSDVARDQRGVQTAAGKHFNEEGIPKGRTPKENAEWWDRLSQEKQEEYLAVHPEIIGKMDGLPSGVRDQANRVVLAGARVDLEEQIRDLDKKEPVHYQPRYNNATGLPTGAKDPTAAWLKWEERRNALKEKLLGIDAIQQRFDRTGEEGLPDAYLLDFDTKKRGHAVIANGNPDTAEHTAVYVPGTTAKLGKVDGDIRRMTGLWRVAATMPGEPSVSTITWIGYDAPQSAYPTHNGDLLPEAASDSYAHKAAPTLKQFLDGVQTVQGGPDASHTTVIGHSYGTTVVGATSMDRGLGADDIVSVASPGMLVGHANELDAPKGHVWSEAASVWNDQVTVGGKIAFLGGNTRLGSWDVTTPVTDWLTQNVPSDRAFGANIMQTTAKDHGGYWDDGSVSLENQAAVVTGRYEQVKRD